MLDTVIDILQSKSRDNEDNHSLKRTLIHLSRLRGSQSSSQKEITLDVINDDFKDLIAQGFWEQSAENDALLEEIRDMLSTSADNRARLGNGRAEKVAAATDDGKQRISIVAPLPISAPLLHQHPSYTTVLPSELLDMLNHVYFMHLLATDPSKVLPPGKSLLSVMSRAHTQQYRAEGEQPTLKDRVEDIVHKAFWSEVCMSF